MKIHAAFVVLLLFISSCSLPYTNSRTSMWSYPSDDSILTFHIDPWNENSLLYSTFDGFFTSNDGGKTWSFLSKQPGNMPIETLLPHPISENTWIGFSKKTIYKSIDGGKTWFNYSKNLYAQKDTFIDTCKHLFYYLFPSLQPRNLELYDVVISSSGTKKIVCGTSNGLYVLKENNSWVHIQSSSKYGEITSLIDLPNLDLMIGLSNNRLLFSIEYETLECISLEHFKSGPIIDILINGENSFLIYSTVGIFQAELLEHEFLKILMHPVYTEENVTCWNVHDNKIWLQTQEKLLFSNNNGNDWSILSFPFSNEIKKIQFSSKQSSTYILTSSHGILYSKNSLNWETRIYSIQECHVTSIQQDAVVPTTVFCSTKNRGVFCSLDRGITWFSISSGIEHKTLHSLLSIQKPYHALFAATQNDGLYVSYNQNYQWSPINTVFTNMSITAMFPSKYDDQPMLIALWDTVYEQSLLYYSLNGGLEWFPVIFPSKINAIEDFDSDPLMFYIGTNHGLYTWNAQSLSYEPTVFTNSITLMQKHPKDKQHIYIGTMSGLYETTDQGEHFHFSSCNDQFHLGSIDDILFFPREPESIILVSGGCLYSSNDSGIAWSRLSQSRDFFFTTIYTDIIEPQALFAGTKSNGVVYSYNKGKNWYSASDFTKF